MALENEAATIHTDKRRLDDSQRLEVLMAQLNDPDRDPTAQAELEREIARLQKTAGAAPAGPRKVAFNGQVHEFPADATDAEIAAALESLAPRPSQADVRASEPQLGPMASQDEKEARFADAYKRFVQATGGTLKPGQNIRQAVQEWSGIQDPMKTREGAEMDELASGGDLQYGDTGAYMGAKGLAAAGGAVLGPAGSTAAEAGVRWAALAWNLKKAVDAGAIDKDRAAEIMQAEMAKGTAADAAANFGVPLLGQVLAKIPGMSWLGSKVADLVAQRSRGVEKLVEKAPTAAGKTAVRELAARSGDTLPTPGQVTGDASFAENSARTVHPQQFEKQQQALTTAANQFRDETLSPVDQPSRQSIGETIIQAADDVQKAVKERLRPTFEEANRLGVAVNLDGVVKIAEDALARNGKVPGGQLKPGEVAKLQQIVDDLRVPGQPASQGAGFTGAATPATPAGVKPVDAEGALDFLSARKADTRAITADGVPTAPFVRLLNSMVKEGEASYQQAAAGAGKADVVKRLIAARSDYGEMMDNVYDDAVKAALKKNPEDVGKHFWQPGNVSEIQQLHRMLAIATKEGAMKPSEVADMTRHMARGFLLEHTPTVEAAAKWSETLKQRPGLHDTWLTLTSQPGGSQLRGAMEVLEQAAQIAGRGNPELLGQSSILLQRAARGGLGISYVTGVIHPGFLVAGLSVDGLTKLMATAYTQGNKGVLNATMRVLRANSVNTVASAKILEETLPLLEKFASEHDIEDLFTFADSEAQAAPAAAPPAVVKGSIPGVNGALPPAHAVPPSDGVRPPSVVRG